MKSQVKMIRAHLDSGETITGLEALGLFDCIHLPRRIRDLVEAGYPIERQTIVTNSGKRIKMYWKGSKQPSPATPPTDAQRNPLNE